MRPKGWVHTSTWDQNWHFGIELFYFISFLSGLLFVSRLFEERRGDIVLGFPWLRGSAPRFLSGLLFVPRLFEERRGDIVLGFPWLRGSAARCRPPPLAAPPPDSRYLCVRNLCQSFWNTSVFVMVWKCACGLYIILRSFFVTFSAF